jgi:PAS domain S-box-containing protein
VALDIAAMVTIAAAFAVILWWDKAAASSLSTAGRITALAYSSLYAGLVMTMIQSLLRRVPLRRHPEFVFLLGGQLCLAIAFFAWTPQLLGQAYAAGSSAIDALWTLGMLGLGAAALVDRGAPLPPRNERDLSRTMALPSIGILALASALPFLAIGDHALGERLAAQAGLLIAGATMLVRFQLLARWHRAVVVEARRSAQEIRDLYDSAPCGYHSFDADGVLLRMNATELSWLGYERDEVVGRMDVRDLLTPESAERWPSLRNMLMSSGALHDVEYELVRRDGTTFPVSLSASVVRDDDGNFVMSRSTVFDITERVRARAELAGVATDLQRSNTELEQFAYAASHDLAEPLRTISSFGQMLSRRYADELDEKGQRFLGHITEGAARMQRLIDSMLVYSRIGRTESVRTEVDARKLVEQVVASLGAAIEATGARVDVGALPPVIASPDQLGQVFQNLLANALKFAAPDRPPELAVSAEREEGAWRFTVADNGIGVEPRHADRIFQMFQRLHTRDEYEGTGIGLALCVRVAERHGGRVWVDSEPGVGSRFHFTIADPQESPA